MYRIAILGCENSHADAFLSFIIKENLYPDIEVAGVYSNEPEAAAKIKEKYGVYVAESYDEFVGKVDGIMITARDGKYHYEYAKPYIASGIPMFIDKPITSDEAEAVEFMKALRAAGVRVTGGSTCIHADYVKELKEAVATEKYGKTLGGYMRAPVHLHSEYGGFFFYAQHLVQVTQEIYGYYPKSVKANVSGKVVNVLVRYDDFDVLCAYADGNYVYYASLSAEKAIVGSQYPITGSCYAPEFNNFYNLLLGKEQKQSYREFIAPVFVICAIERSMRSGKEEAVNTCEEI